MFPTNIEKKTNVFKLVFNIKISIKRCMFIFRQHIGLNAWKIQSYRAALSHLFLFNKDHK